MKLRSGSLLLLLCLLLSSHSFSQVLTFNQIGDVNGPVKHIYKFNGNYWITGDFTMLDGGTPCTVAGWAVWDGTAFLNLPLTAPPGNAVTALGEYQGNLIAAGSFDNSWPDDAILSYNGSNWSALHGTTSDGPAQAEIRAIQEFAGKLYVGGRFSALKGSITANHIAAWNGSDWEVLRPDVSEPAGISGSVPIVHDMEIYTGLLAIAGRFGAANGDPMDKVTLWNGAAFISTKHASPTQNVAYNGTILDLNAHLYGQRLFAIGSFNSIEGEPTANLAFIQPGAPNDHRWQINSQPDFVWQFNSNVDENAAAMVEANGSLWAAGSFSGALGVDLDNFFKYTVAFPGFWSTLDAQHRGTDAMVRAMVIDTATNNIIMGGEFSTILGHNGGSDLQRNRLVQFSPTPLSLQSAAETEPISVYPNPAGSAFQVKLPASFEPGWSLRVMDVNGRTVGEWAELADRAFSFSVAGWSPGLYSVLLLRADGVQMQGRLWVE